MERKKIISEAIRRQPKGPFSKGPQFGGPQNGLRPPHRLPSRDYLTGKNPPKRKVGARPQIRIPGKYR